METILIEENAAVLAASKGDRAAFGALVRQFQRRAYAAAYALVGNREDALELSQEAFVRAFHAMGRFDTKMPFYPWLHRIVRNTCLNHLKKKRRHGETSLDGMMETGFDVRDARPGASHEAELGDMRQDIVRAMDALPEEQREILRLRHFSELSYEEIAQCLDIPPATVMSRLHTARKRLRQLLEKGHRYE